MGTFEDDFENGTSNWTGLNSIGWVASISNEHAHHGKYSFKTVGGLQTAQASIHKTPLPLRDEYYARAYLRFANLPTSFSAGAHYFGPTLISADNMIGGVGFRTQAGPTYNWSVINFANNGSFQNYHAVASPTVIDTWYALEIYVRVHATAGVIMLWLDDTLIINQTGLKTDLFGQINGILEWNYGAGDSWYDPATAPPITTYHDCIRVDTKKIGLETVDMPLIYNEDKILVEEATKLPSTSSAVMGNYGCRVRTMRHLTPISPWTAK